MTDIVDKYSGSSSDLLLINSRMGAGVSKDTLKRYINNKCIQLEVPVHEEINSKMWYTLCYARVCTTFFSLFLHEPNKKL
jgi:hypothetical protein